MGKAALAVVEYSGATMNQMCCMGVKVDFSVLMLSPKKWKRARPLLITDNTLGRDQLWRSQSLWYGKTIIPNCCSLIATTKSTLVKTLGAVERLKVSTCIDSDHCQLWTIKNICEQDALLHGYMHPEGQGLQTGPSGSRYGITALKVTILNLCAWMKVFRVLSSILLSSWEPGNIWSTTPS